MRPASFGRGGPPAGAGLPALLLALLLACAASDAPPAVEYRPAASLERLQARAVPAPGLGLPVDFDHDAGFDHGAGSLYLLERGGRVVILERAVTAWHAVAEVGRRGSGPGEFRNPSGIAILRPSYGELTEGLLAVVDAVDSARLPAAAAGDSDGATRSAAAHAVIVVSEGRRLQYFSGDGSYIGGETMQLPCTMLRPRVHAAEAGLYVEGDCTRRGFVTDTAVAVLMWSRGAGVFRPVAEEVRYTRDGSVGNVFGARTAFSTGTAGRHLFGAAASNCYWRIEDGPAEPVAQRRCPAASQQYRADAPPELLRRIRRGSVAGVRVEWPNRLPAYMERVAVAGTDVLLRPFSADSVVLQTAAPESRDLAVAPLDGLVSCKAAGCLWVLEDGPEPRVLFLTMPELADLALRDGARRP